MEICPENSKKFYFLINTALKWYIQIVYLKIMKEKTVYKILDMKELLLGISGLKGSATKTNECINKQIRLMELINRKIDKLINQWIMKIYWRKRISQS